VVRGLVRAEMARGSGWAAVRGPEVVVRPRASAGVGTVPVGAAPVSPSGAAPARLVRLDVVVARALYGGSGQLAPVELAAARRLIRAGGVDVSGRGVHELAPDLLVGAGEVVLR
jgi:hypothetical protein